MALEDDVSLDYLKKNKSNFLAGYFEKVDADHAPTFTALSDFRSQRKDDPNSESVAGKLTVRTQ
jgi:hypothetical protein